MAAATESLETAEQRQRTSSDVNANVRVRIFFIFDLGPNIKLHRAFIKKLNYLSDRMHCEQN